MPNEKTITTTPNIISLYTEDGRNESWKFPDGTVVTMTVPNEAQCEDITRTSDTMMLRNFSDVYIIRLPVAGAAIIGDKRAYIELVKHKENV